ncbi:MAG TPA: phage protease, partial [Myxococcota bacterium]|nr:phage protease [Myxococcota bacterium]
MPRQLFNCNTAKPFALDQAADGKPPPEWVNILPPPDSDGKIYSRDFRVVQVDDLEDLARRSNALLKKQKGGAPVDLDHKLYGGWFDTGGGPVVAWAEEFRADTDGLHARVDWLKTGAEKVTGREYGYTSSVIDGPVKWEFDEDGWPTTLILHADAIVGFGLTNIPALETTRMFAAASTEALELETLRAFARKIGVPEGATPEQMRAAFKRFTAAPESGEIVDADGRA